MSNSKNRSRYHQNSVDIKNLVCPRGPSLVSLDKSSQINFHAHPLISVESPFTVDVVGCDDCCQNPKADCRAPSWLIHWNNGFVPVSTGWLVGLKQIGWFWVCNFMFVLQLYVHLSLVAFFVKQAKLPRVFGSWTKGTS